jgi:hypothetical protein
MIDKKGVIAEITPFLFLYPNLVPLLYWTYFPRNAEIPSTAGSTY